MIIQDLKITSEDYTSKDIAGLPDRPSEAGMSAADLKARFDAATKRIVQPKFNQLIDLLNGTEGADNIGIKPIEGLSGYTVQQILTAVKLLLDDKQSIEQSNKDVDKKFDKTEAQALVKEVIFSEDSGVFTITKYDGSVQTYDTALEKVALDVRLDGQQFVLTLTDGTEQRVDLSAFITQTEVKSSDTITLAIENGAIVARITSGSVMLSHLNAEVTAYIDEKEAAAANSAAAAKLSEQNALNSANTAKASEQAAKACQEQACSCATQAGLSRDAAKASEQAAKEAADRAVEAAGGDFVTNTAFNQFKETVPTLDDGKVSVQQGGLYINSETTEEDKAEAQEALKEIGGFLPLDGSVQMGEGLIAQIQSLIDSGVISMSAVKSVQRGIITIAADKTEGTATITAVDTTKAVVLFGGSIYGYTGNTYSNSWDARLVLSSATKVTATRAYAPHYNATVPYQVLEFV